MTMSNMWRRNFVELPSADQLAKKLISEITSQLLGVFAPFARLGCYIHRLRNKLQAAAASQPGDELLVLAGLTSAKLVVEMRDRERDAELWG